MAASRSVELRMRGHDASPTAACQGASGSDHRGASDMTVDWGDLRRTTPVSRAFGFERGKPVDRHYIEAFLDTCRDDVKGRVLEVGDANYPPRFGAGRVERADIYDRRGNADATITGE